MTNFFKTRLNRLFGGVDNVAEALSSGPSASPENVARLKQYKWLRESEIEAKESSILRGQTEVQAQTNFRTIVGKYQFFETNNECEPGAKSTVE